MKLHTIELKYKQVVQPKTGAAPHHEIDAENGGEGQYKYVVEAPEPSEEPRHAGDTMAFKSDLGYITVELPPEEFEPRWFSTDPYFCQQNNLKVGEPVKIIKELPKKFKYWC